MSLGELRDLFIVIYAIAGIGAIIFLSIIAFLIFRRVRSILDSGKATVTNIREITSMVSDKIVKPVTGVASFVQGLRRAVEFISGLSRRKEGKKGGKRT